MHGSAARDGVGTVREQDGSDSLERYGVSFWQSSDEARMNSA